MAKRKAPRKKKSAGKKKPAPRKKLAPKKKVASKKKPIRRKKAAGRGTVELTNPVGLWDRRGTGSASGGQSGDTQGLSEKEDVDSESVEELAEEGQDFEAEAVSGVENAKDPDQGEVTTREVPEDDVPLEYQDPDQS
ncbi:MAG: hypothetical protein WBF06_00950 [Candidatus Acidiferrales bacterium]